MLICLFFFTVSERFLDNTGSSGIFGKFRVFPANNGIIAIISNIDIDRLRFLHTDTLQSLRARICGAISIGAGITFFLQLYTWLTGLIKIISLVIVVPEYTNFQTTAG